MENDLEVSQPWLKSMQNGGLGEARAKAFLLERFWVLERSVDIQGADYLIQRRLTNQNFMDSEAPKLGVVQVKFIQDGATYIKLNKNYVCDSDGRKYNEFFLMVFTGVEDNARSFLLSTTEIINNFRLKSDSGKEYYSIQGKILLETDRFEVKNKNLALNKIDHALKIANFVNNRRLLSSTNYVELNPDFIDHDLSIALDNGYGDIKKEFYSYKKKVRSTLFEIEGVVEGMTKILNTTDPEEAYTIYLDEISDHFTRYPTESISFTAEYFEDEEFLEAVQNHKKRLIALRELGVENNFFCLLNEFVEQIADQTSKLEIQKNDKVKVIVKYNQINLELESINVEKLQEAEEIPNELQSILGLQEYIFSPETWLSYDIRSERSPRPVSVDEFKEQYLRFNWTYKKYFQVELERHLIGGELVAPWMEQYLRNLS